jgi:hypothetical protein
MTRSVNVGVEQPVDLVVDTLGTLRRVPVDEGFTTLLMTAGRLANTPADLQRSRPPGVDGNW